MENARTASHMITLILLLSYLTLKFSRYITWQTGKTGCGTFSDGGRKTTKKRVHCLPRLVTILRSRFRDKRGKKGRDIAWESFEGQTAFRRAIRRWAFVFPWDLSSRRSLVTWMDACTQNRKLTSKGLEKHILLNLKKEKKISKQRVPLPRIFHLVRAWANVSLLVRHIQIPLRNFSSFRYGKLSSA